MARDGKPRRQRGSNYEQIAIGLVYDYVQDVNGTVPPNLSAAQKRLVAAIKAAFTKEAKENDRTKGRSH